MPLSRLTHLSVLLPLPVAIVLETINRAMFEVEGGGDTMYDPDTSTYHNFPLEIYQSQKTSKMFEQGAPPCGCGLSVVLKMSRCVLAMEACSHEVAVTMQFEEGDDCEVSIPPSSSLPPSFLPLPPPPHLLFSSFISLPLLPTFSPSRHFMCVDLPPHPPPLPLPLL